MLPKIIASINNCKIDVDQYQRINEYSPIGIACIDPQTETAIAVNQVLLEMLGLTRDSIQTQNIFSLLSDLSNSTKIDHLKKLLEGAQNKLLRKHEITLQATQGITPVIKTFHISTVLIPELGLQLSFEDITKLKEQENAFQSALEEEHHRLKNNFSQTASVISLTSDTIIANAVVNTEEINSLIDVIKAGTATSKEINRLIDVIAAIDINAKETIALLMEVRLSIQCVSMIHQYLHELADQTGKIDISEFFVKMLKENIEFYKTTIRKNTVFTANYQIEPIHLNASICQKYALIIVELMSNSVKQLFKDESMNIKDLHIDIRINKTEKNIYMTVKDNGIGFPENFDITKTTGLGLKIVQAFIKELEGTIKTTNNNGAQVEIIFPLPTESN